MSYRNRRQKSVSTVLVSMRCSSWTMYVWCIDIDKLLQFLWRLRYLAMYVWYIVYILCYFAEYWQIVIFFSDGYSVIYSTIYLRLQASAKTERQKWRTYNLVKALRHILTNKYSQNFFTSCVSRSNPSSVMRFFKVYPKIVRAQNAPELFPCDVVRRWTGLFIARLNEKFLLVPSLP